MKPYRNIYVTFLEESAVFSGTLEIPYTGEITYGAQEPYPGYDPEQDILYRCPCDLSDIKCFKKV